MTSIRLPEAGAFALARVEVVANRRPARTPRMRATRAIAATVESVKGVVKNLDIPYSFFCRLSLSSQLACKRSRLHTSLHREARDEKEGFTGTKYRSCGPTRTCLSRGRRTADFMHEREG